MAVVVGGAGKIGRAIAVALRARGARLAVRDFDSALKRAAGVPADFAVACDVTDAAAVDAAFARARDALAPVELLVNSAGMATRAPVAELSVADWDRKGSLST
jgi:NAD(P)-dependent dehydrogenase (short-subunit alcohol dehydrogenase family)